MYHTLFAGCSYSAGTGFALAKDEPTLWVNQIHDRFFSDTKKLNVSTGGRSNAKIFQDTMWHLLHKPIKFAIVQWTNMPRYDLELGFELYDTHQTFIAVNQCRDHHLNDMKYSGSYLNKVGNRFTALAHDCYEIFNLVQYVNIILNCAKLTQTQVFFVNGICPWDSNFFAKKTQCAPNQYTAYTQKILNSHNRDDDEILALYDKMHERFDSAGGIQAHSWLNLYSSMSSQKIDFNSDLVHPGPESNNQYSQQLSSALSASLI